jgi:hypothetical protein
VPPERERQTEANKNAQIPFGRSAASPGPQRVETRGLIREELIAVAMLGVGNATGLAGRAGKRVAVTTVHVAGGGLKRVGRHRAKRRVRKLEGKLTAAAKRLPVDTPVDRRRRERTTGRVVLTVRLALASAVLVAVYLAWRSHNRRKAEGTAEAGPAPDAFGAAVEATDDGEHVQATSTQP